MSVSLANWRADPYLYRWVGSKDRHTQDPYIYGMLKFLQFSGMSPEELIEEKCNDLQLRPSDRTNVAERRIVGFKRWLKNNYKMGENWARNGNRTLSEKSRLTYIAAVLSFYRANGIRFNVRALGIKGLCAAEARRGTGPLKMSAEQVQMLANHLPTVRDKALAWLLFQSGLDGSVALDLNWGDIANEFTNPPKSRIQFEDGVADVPSVMIRVTKSNGCEPEHRTYICRTSIETLTAYLQERRGEDFARTMQQEDPLFANVYGRNAGGRYRLHSFDRLLRIVGSQLGPVEEKRRFPSPNKLRPASLSESFSNELNGVKCNLEYIQYWTGQTDSGREYTEAERKTYCKFAYLGLEPNKAVHDGQSCRSDRREIQVRSRRGGC